MLCGQRLASPGNNGLQRLGARILVWVQPFAVFGDAELIDDSKTEAAFARRQNYAIQWCKRVGEGADSILNSNMGIHKLRCS